MHLGARNEHSQSTGVAAPRSGDQLDRKRVGSQPWSKGREVRRSQGGADFGELCHARYPGPDGHVGADDDSATGRGASQLPPVQVTAPEEQHRANSAPAQRAERGGQRRRAQAARRPPQSEPAPKAFTELQDARTGTVGVYANSTSVATKTNTPLVNIPQSVTVVTKDFIRDQSFQSVTEVTRTSPALRFIRARATATSSSSAASTPAPISTSTAFAMTSSISAISTTRRASKSLKDRARWPSGVLPAVVWSTAR